MFEKVSKKLKRDVNVRELMTGSLISFFFKMLGMLMGYILVYLISKKNGPEGVGFYNLFNQVLIILSMITGLGLNTAVLRFVAQFNNDSERSKLHSLYKHITRIVIPVCLIVSIVLFFSAKNISFLLKKDEEYIAGIKLIAIVLPFFAMNQISVEFIRALKKLQISELIRSVIRPTVMVILFLILWLKPLENKDILTFFIIGSIINSTVSGGTIWLELKKIPKDPSSTLTSMEMIKTSSSMMLTSISSTLMVAFPIFFLEYYTTQRDVGIYSVAFRISSVISLVLVVVNTISAPKFAELFWQDKKEELQKFVFQSSKIIFFVSFMLSIIFIVFSESILALFGKEFTSGKGILIILVLGQLINAITGSVGALQNMSGNQKMLRNNVLMVMLLSGIAYFFIVPLYGFIGAAVVSALGVCIININSTIIVYKKLNIIAFYLPSITKTFKKNG